ncbi:MAG: hypothetical protein ABIP74_03970 [Candidatus Saccharimonas sp.]
MNKHERQTTEHTRLHELVTSWRSRALAITITEQSYPHFGEDILLFMNGVLQDAEELTTNPVAPDVPRFVVYFVSIIQDGCAELFADWREGTELSGLQQQIKEAQDIWADQLRLGD